VPLLMNRTNIRTRAAGLHQ